MAGFYNRAKVSSVCGALSGDWLRVRERCMSLSPQDTRNKSPPPLKIFFILIYIYLFIPPPPTTTLPRLAGS